MFMIQKFTAVYKKAGKWYTGWVEEIPGANTQGKTLSEVKKNLKEAIRLIIETNRALQKKDISANKVIREPITISTS